MSSYVLAQPYMDAVSALQSEAGNWLSIGDGLDSLAFEFDLALGGGNVTGAVQVEYTAQLNGTMPAVGTRFLLSASALHTTLTTAALSLAPDPSLEVTLTAVTTGRFAIVLGPVPAGNIRCNYVYTSGDGAAPNSVTCWAIGWGRGR